jgi:hypothetical protein
MTIVTTVFVDGVDVIPQEVCLLRSGMGNQRLRFGEFQPEYFMQERVQTALYRLRFCPRADESYQEIIGVPTVAQAAVVGVVRID